MPKFRFKPDDLRRCFAMAKVVKPQTNDICIRFIGDSLVLFTSDRRRYVRAEVRADPVDKLPDGYSSDDFYITVDRSALFDSDLDSVTVSVNEKSLTIHTLSSDQSRQATLKQRSIRSRRPPIPDRRPGDGKVRLDSTSFDSLLKQVSCSAQVRETKTEEDMRVNQVHFYGDSGCAVSNARFYGSVAYLPSMSVDMSIVSNDVPLIKSFISKSSSPDVHVSQDSARLYVEDPGTGSFLALSKVSCNRPALSLLDREDFKTTVVADQGRLSQSLDWALLALEGTQRVSLKTSRPDGSSDAVMELFAGSQELSKIPVSIVSGDGIRADFPARFLASIVGYIGGKQVALKFGHPRAPSILELSASGEDGSVQSFHYLQAMKERV